MYHVTRALKKEDSASGEGFSLTPEEQLKFQSILYWFIDFFSQNVENALLNEESMIFFI